jgi:phosphotriesterase-related protein
MVRTVLGPVAADDLGMTDAHTHVWIAPPPGTAADAPRLTDQAAIAAELAEYRAAGGGGIVDCQPGGCGRDGRVLARLARQAGLHVVACTGYHRRRYYPDDAAVWRLTAEQATALFVDELTEALGETREAPIVAGFVKAACEATVADTPAALLAAVAEASRRTGAAVGVHTERGADAEAIVDFFDRRGVPPARLVLFHMDKRPDFALHRTLAAAGVLLEYDTFYRPQYDPDTNAWPLIERMVAHDLEHAVALGTDVADAAMWARLGRGPGLPGFAGAVRARLQARVPASAVGQLMGANIARRLAWRAAGEA